jgi:hypothetical protein
MAIHRGVSSSPERILRPEHPERPRRKVLIWKADVRVWNQPLTTPKQKFRLTIPASVFP